jgi:ABC-type uncharacterized transport system fused permease/ATPase subunit
MGILSDSFDPREMKIFLIVFLIMVAAGIFLISLMAPVIREIKETEEKIRESISHPFYEFFKNDIVVKKEINDLVNRDRSLKGSLFWSLILIVFIIIVIVIIIFLLKGNTLRESLDIIWNNTMNLTLR